MSDSILTACFSLKTCEMMTTVIRQVRVQCSVLCVRNPGLESASTEWHTVWNISLSIGRVAYVRIGSLDESRSDCSTTERPGGGRAACLSTELNGGFMHRKSWGKELWDFDVFELRRSQRISQGAHMHYYCADFLPRGQPYLHFWYFVFPVVSMLPDYVRA